MALTKVHNRMLKDAAVNVKDYNAIGDGVTDDSDAFVAACATGRGLYVPQGTYLVDGLKFVITSNPYVIFEGATIKRRILDGADKATIRVLSSTGCTFYGELEIDGNKGSFTTTSTDRERDGLEVRNCSNFVNAGVIKSHDNVGHGVLGAVSTHCSFGHLECYDNGASTAVGFRDDGFASVVLTYSSISKALFYGNTRYGFSVTGLTTSHDNTFTNIHTYNNDDGGVDFETTGSNTLRDSSIGDATNGWETFLCTHSNKVYVENISCKDIYGGAVGSETTNITFKSVNLYPSSGNSNITLYGANPTLEDIYIYNSGLSFTGKTVSITGCGNEGTIRNVWCENSRIFEIQNIRYVTHSGATTMEAGTVYQINGLSLTNTSGERLIEVRDGVVVSILNPAYNLGLEATAAQISSRVQDINANFKYNSKLVWDTTNNRLLRASGSGDTDPWYVVDGSASVTPT